MAKKKTKRANGEGSYYQRPDKKWVGQITTGTDPKTGKLKRKSFYGKTRTEVKNKVEGYIKSQSLFIGSEEAFGSWIVYWMDNYQKINLRETTWSSYQYPINIHIIPNIGHIQLKDLRSGDIQELYNKMSESDLKPATIRRVHQIIKGALDQAVEDRMLEWNPALSSKPPKVKKSKERAFSLQEMSQFLPVLDTDRLGVAYLSIMGTGLRKGELLGLKWSDINLDSNIIEVKRALAYTPEKGLFFEDPKSEDSFRKVPIPPVVCSALEKHREQQEKEKKALGKRYSDQELVFCTVNGTPIHPRNLLRNFYILRNRVGLPKDLNIHSLRHTYATRLLETKENLRTVQELLGHADMETTGNIYSHVSLEVKHEAAAKINDFLTYKKASSN